MALSGKLPMVAVLLRNILEAQERKFPDVIKQVVDMKFVKVY